MAPVDFDVVEEAERRPHNAFWSLYDRILAHDLRGKRVLVPGCGFGEDAARLARLGAEVEAFDISPDVIAIARRRGETHGYRGVNFSVAPAESSGFADNSFDFALVIDILHHVDIEKTVAELVRVLKPGGRIIGNELYTHGALQKRVRESWLVDRALYPAMRRFIYGAGTPYITPDERKIDEKDFAMIERAFPSLEAEWFNLFIGRLLPDRFPIAAKLDRALMQAVGDNGRIFAGRVVFEGVVAK